MAADFSGLKSNSSDVSRNYRYASMRLERNGDVYLVSLFTFRQVLTLDYFMWGYLQAEVDKHKPQDMAALKYAIRKCVRETPLSGYTRNRKYYVP